ncbi:vacuolar lysine transporter Ypq1p [Diutina catenulata]
MLNTAVEVLKHHHPVATPWRVQISGLMGSTSLACWIVLLVPQLIEQWRLKSADGIAIGFITIWFTGDIFNLVGAVWAHLLPEVIFLAIWFCIADTLMVASYVYYSKIYPKHHHHSHHHRAESDETEPLIQGTRRRRSSTLTDIAIDPSSHSVFTKYVLPMLFVLAAGSAGYFLSDAPPVSDDPEPIVIGPQIMGYVSAILYLGARIPQIIQNHRRRSVDGLSLLFFLFSTLGNLTYAGQILFYRSDHQYIMLNMPWLLGSLGTIAEDSIIFAQFYMYRNHHTVIE